MNIITDSPNVQSFRKTNTWILDIEFVNFSQPAENNKLAILERLKQQLAGQERVVEVGSGSGQHAIFFVSQMPEIIWQPTDQGEYFSGLHSNIERYLNDTHEARLLLPRTLDLNSPRWPAKFDVVYSANVVHIMPEALLPQLFSSQANKVLLYGPYKYSGQFTSESNERFNEWLKSRNELSGIRDIEAVQNIAGEIGYQLTSDTPMPANNQFLAFERQ